jgi:hypothetical protein
MLDGATNGALYALLALATVLVFAITRVILIPQGEFVTYGALTLGDDAERQLRSARCGRTGATSRHRSGCCWCSR